MKNYLITGGTDGMGKEIALQLLRDGERVIVIGSSAEKGTLFLSEAGQSGAGQRAAFIQADLSLLSETRRVAREVYEKVDALDGLVFCAVSFKQRTEPLITEEGFETIFALIYLSRFVLSYELTDLLEKSVNPIIVNFGSAGVYVEIQWDNIQYVNDFICNNALIQGGKLNDPLGVYYAESHPSGKTKYILYSPGAVKTNGIMKEMPAALVAQYQSIGRTAAEAVEPLMPIIKNPPQERLYALSVEGPVSLDSQCFDPLDARRLYAITTHLLDA